MRRPSSRTIAGYKPLSEKDFVTSGERKVRLAQGRGGIDWHNDLFLSRYTGMTISSLHRVVSALTCMESSCAVPVSVLKTLTFISRPDRSDLLFSWGNDSVLSNVSFVPCQPTSPLLAWIKITKKGFHFNHFTHFQSFLRWCRALRKIGNYSTN